ncbi:MAG: helicase C-terminal domain-containing protein [Pirellulales bacterium]
MLTVADILGTGGSIARRLTNYEARPQQIEMAEAVAAAIAAGEHLVVEAGTGVGKSFAYLVPAILAATQPEAETTDADASAEDEADDDAPRRPRRIVVSTHTISLQEQLLGKDLPLLKGVIPRDFSAVLAKGRGNYVSLRRLEAAAARGGSLFTDAGEFEQIRDLVKWSKTTHDGTLADMPFRPLPQVWDEAASDSGNCLGRSCPRHKDCFYFAARRRLEHAQIMIVNHALFFSDLALRRQGVNLLPDYDVAILDEAHTLEATAGDHLGLRIASSQVDYILSKLYNDRTNKGLLVTCSLAEPQQEVMRCRHRADTFFRDVQDWFEQQGGNGRVRKPGVVHNDLGPALAALGKMVRKEGNRIKDEVERQDFTSAGNRLETLGAAIDEWVDQSTEGSVYWVETEQKRRGTRVTLAASPIDVAPVLAEHLFSQVKTVILTSATLAVGRDAQFDFFKTRLGATKARGKQLGSPFDYQRQATLILLDGMPDPSSQREAYDRLVPKMIRRYVHRTGGHAFVLFTSYQLLQRAAKELEASLGRDGLRLFCQGAGMPRHQMLEQFKATRGAVLFGTDSFWQGVDVPGEALQNVIITKIPFSVPDRPLLEARLDAIRHRGGVPFREYQLPEAAIKLKQGFGRLIRSSQDTGQVVILDPRVRSKPYGKLLLESLPDCRVVIEQVD